MKTRELETIGTAVIEKFKALLEQAISTDAPTNYCNIIPIKMQ